MAIRTSQTKVATSLRGINLKGIQIRLVDAENQMVGALASQLAVILQGKDKPTYNPSREEGDVCVVINAAKVTMTRKKWDKKMYRWHSGYPGGLRERTAKEVFKRKPEDILWRAVSGMIPKNHLRSVRMQKLLLFREGHNLKDVPLMEWKMPDQIVKKLKTEEAVQAPRRISKL